MRSLFFAVCAVTAIAAGGMWSSACGQVLIVGNDEKQAWDENAKPILREPGKDTLSVLDISKPDAPHITATMPLINRISPVGRRSSMNVTVVRSGPSSASVNRPVGRAGPAITLNSRRFGGSDCVTS